ncbi:MAG: cell division protein SepF [Clostridia bacterium]|nr:cell division protein SepF [Clostridia bacterium]
MVKGKVQELNNSLGTKDIKVFTPLSLTDVEEIISYLKYNPLIINTSKIKENKKQRLLDLMTGAICALDKNICVLDKDNYLFIKK